MDTGSAPSSCSPWPGLTRPPSDAKRQHKEISRGAAEPRSTALLRDSASPREKHFWRADARRLGGVRTLPLRTKPGHGENI
jgi:hypothetical protein